MKRKSSGFEITVDMQEGDIKVHQTGTQCDDSFVSIPLEQIEWLCEQLRELKERTKSNDGQT